ncbi:unnamed protein product [Colias eurytheme]|nr:unnamed protein product [Colias eurytheme]
MYFFGVLATILVASSFAADAPAPQNAQSNACARRNSYLPVDGQCDAYVECTDYVPSQKLCPDGLHYDPTVAWPNYPCGYPSAVTCKSTYAIQPAQATKDCPHQFGYFPSPIAAPNDCGQYRMCISGKPYEMTCSTGLAFDFSNNRCNWPDLVASCNAEKYLGYQCPAASFDESGNPIKTNHKFANNCYAFYSCLSGKPRLLSCDSGFAFDPASGECIDADKVACNDNAQAVPQ